MGNAEAKELYLYIENDGDLYRQQRQPIMQNLVQKIDRGVYDREKAIKLFMFLMESGSKKYVKEFGSPGDKWFEMFDKPTRELVAKNFVANFEAEYKLGNFTNETYHKKKYRGKEGVLKNPAAAGKKGYYFFADLQEYKHLTPKELSAIAYKHSANSISGPYPKNTVSMSRRLRKNPATGMPKEQFNVLKVKFADPGSGHGGPHAKGVIADVRIDGDNKQITYWTDVTADYAWITEIYHGYGQGQKGFTKSNAYVDGKGLPKKYSGVVSFLKGQWRDHFEKGGK